MRKKWLALALSMAMVVGSITGCGGSDSNKDASDSSKSNDSAKVKKFQVHRDSPSAP